MSTCTPTSRNVRPLDNINRFRVLLPEGDPFRIDPNAPRHRKVRRSR